MNMQAFAYFLETHRTPKSDGNAASSSAQQPGHIMQPNETKPEHAEIMHLAGVISADIAKLVAMVTYGSNSDVSRVAQNEGHGPRPQQTRLTLHDVCKPA